MDDLAHDPDQPVRRAIAIEDTARLEDRRGMLKGLSQAVALYNVSSASKTTREVHLTDAMHQGLILDQFKAQYFLTLSRPR